MKLNFVESNHPLNKNVARRTSCAETQCSKDPNRIWTKLKTVYLFSKTIKKPINTLMVDQFFIFTWKSWSIAWADLPLEQLWLAPRQWMEHSWRGNPKKGIATSPKSSAFWALQHFPFFPEIARALKPETQVHGSDVFYCSLGRFHGPRFFFGNLHFALDLSWKHVARWLLCWIPVWPADPLNV